MRSVKTLLKVLKKNQHLFDSGMCKWIESINKLFRITDQEALLLKRYLFINRPKYRFIDTYAPGYYWSPGNINFRLKWIDKHIKLLENAHYNNTRISQIITLMHGIGLMFEHYSLFKSTISHWLDRLGPTYDHNAKTVTFGIMPEKTYLALRKLIDKHHLNNLNDRAECGNRLSQLSDELEVELYKLLKHVTHASMCRSNLKILKILLENIHLLHSQIGLCGLSMIMDWQGKITTKEQKAFQNYLFDIFPGYEGSYIWPIGQKEPRIEWLNKQIKLLENQIKT